MAEVETEMRMLPIDEHLEAAVQDILSKGWALAPGFKPMAIYALMRVKDQAAPNDGIGISPRMTLDDDGVGILRNGQLVKN